MAATFDIDRKLSDTDDYSSVCNTYSVDEVFDKCYGILSTHYGVNVKELL